MTRRIVIVGPPGDPLVDGHARLLEAIGWTALVANPSQRLPSGSPSVLAADLRVIGRPRGMAGAGPWERRRAVAGRRARKLAAAGTGWLSRSLEDFAPLAASLPLPLPLPLVAARNAGGAPLLDPELARELASLQFNENRDLRWLAGELARVRADLVISFDRGRGCVLAEAARQLADCRAAHVVALTDPRSIRPGSVTERAILAADGIAPLRPEGLEWLAARDYGGRYSLLPLIGIGASLEAIRDHRAPGPVSARRTLVLDGRQDESGRAFVAVRAVGLAADALRGAEIVVADPSPDVELATRLAAQETGLRLRPLAIRDGGERLRLLGRARCVLAAAESGPTPPLLIEGMAAGAYPISGPGVAGDWIVPGYNGALIPPNDPARIAEALRSAMTDDGLVAAAAASNDEALRPHLARDAMIEPMLHLYGMAIMRPEGR